MNFIEKIKEQAKRDKKRIILTEPTDERIIKAAEIVLKDDLADLILIGDEKSIKNSLLKQTTIINPKTNVLTEKYVEKLMNLRKISKKEATKLLLNNYMYYACMLVLDERADGIVSGACHSTAETIEPALQIIKSKSDTKLISSFFLMMVPDCHYGENGIFLFADCGLKQNPTAEELAIIAGSSAKSFEKLVGTTPYVAMLSHSTKGSASHPDIDKVIKATKIAKKNFPQYHIDGELQLDAAIVPEVSKNKVKNSDVAGKANVLIFPDLDSGNIGYKLVQRLAKAESYGPITQGINKPVNDLSRGCSIDDIVGVIAITVVQAQNN